MPRILLILSVILIIAAGAFSFLTTPKIESYKADLKASKSDLASKKKEFEKFRDDLKLAQDQSTDAKKDVDKAVAERNTAKAELQTAKAQAKEALDKLTAATADAEALKDKLAASSDTKSGDNPAVVELTAKLKEAETKLGELETVNQTLTTKNTETETKLTVLAKADSLRAGRVMAKGLTGQVLAVNRSYNFIVISLGDKQGVVMNGEMLIKRGSSQVAKVKITSVEPTTSIADIVPGSVGRGIAVQAGDEVIYPGVGI